MPTVIVFVTNNNRVLIGCGGKYLMDSETYGTQSATNLANQQRFPGPDTPATRDAAIAEFQTRRPGEKFIPPEWKLGSGSIPDRWTTRYVQPVCEPTRRGFIKGGMTAKDGGDPRNTALREMEEETGFEMDPTKLTQITPTLFHYPATDVEASAILASWSAMSATELVELTWQPIASVGRINPESMNVLPSLPGRATRYVPPHKRNGGKKTRRRRGRKVNKQKTRRS
jgi:hypothetical protein